MHKLLMFSGGLDSTYLLYKLLKESDDHLWVHHIQLMSKENRWREERKAVKQIIQYCKSNIRDFSYSESIWKFNFTKYFAYDIEVVAFVAAQIIPNIYSKNLGPVYVVTGRVKNDDEAQSSLNQTEHTDLLWKTLCKRHSGKVINELHRPIRHMYKKELIPELPKELFDMVWYCRRPQNGQVCNVCRTCLQMKKSLTELKMIK